MSKWIKIENKLPSYGEDVILAYKEIKNYVTKEMSPIIITIGARKSTDFDCEVY